MKKKIFWVIIILVIVIAGVALIKIRKRNESKLPVAESYAMVVSSITPAYGQTQLTLPYIALVQNDADVNLVTKIAGRVDFIKASGAKVHKGEVIVKLDDTDIRSTINSLDSQIKANETALNNLKATHNRTLELLKIKGASIEQSQQEESKIAGLEAQVESLRQKHNEAKNRLSYAVIKSPVKGTLSKTLVNTGDVVMPGYPAVNISAENGSFLLVRVPGNLTVDGVIFNNKPYKAISLNSSFNGLDEYKVYIDNVPLTTGSREQVEVVVFDGEGIKLPHDALLNRNGKSYVLVIDGAKATTKEVNILQSGEDGVVIANQQLVNNSLVVAKQDVLLKLASGVLLKIKNEE